jgi:tungstate transport system ATP-binding protein
MSKYDLIGISKRYDGRVVLTVPDLHIPASQTTAILGPSGAGKSTLLRLLNFLEAPDTGELRYNGLPVPPAGPSLALRRSVTTVFQRPLLLDTTVWGNVAYSLRVRGRPDPALVDASLRQVGMAHLAQARARTLSGGEAQRVALARALVVAPEVLLLDEPTANLDPANVAAIEAIVAELRGRGTTIVIVSHNLFQAQRLADNAVLLVGGALVEVGPLAQLFAQPRDSRTADFLAGRMVY